MFPVRLTYKFVIHFVQLWLYILARELQSNLADLCQHFYSLLITVLEKQMAFTNCFMLQRSATV